MKVDGKMAIGPDQVSAAATTLERNRRPRVLFLTQFFPSPQWPFQTGGTRSNLNLVRALAAKSDVTVRVLEPLAMDARDFADEAFRVAPSPAPAWSGPELVRHWVPFVHEQLESCFREYGVPDLLLTTGLTVCGFSAAALPHAVRTVAIIRAFENFGVLPPRGVSASLRLSILKRSAITRGGDGRALRRADCIVTNSDFMRTTIARRFRVSRDRIRVIPIACNVQGRTGTSASRKRVGFVTRGADKGLGFVLSLAAQTPDYSFLIFGHIAQPPEALPPNVTIKGWEADRAKMLQSAFVWLVPSTWPEPFGRISVEAQAAGNPVLVSRVGGLPETALDPRFVMSDFSERRWAAALRQLSELKEAELLEISERARARFSDIRHDQAVTDILQIERTRS